MHDNFAERLNVRLDELVALIKDTMPDDVFTDHCVAQIIAASYAILEYARRPE